MDSNSVHHMFIIIVLFCARIIIIDWKSRINCEETVQKSQQTINSNYLVSLKIDNPRLVHQYFRNTQCLPASFQYKLWLKYLSILNVCALCFRADTVITDILML